MSSSASSSSSSSTFSSSSSVYTDLIEHCFKPRPMVIADKYKAPTRVGYGIPFYCDELAARLDNCGKMRPSFHLQVQSKAPISPYRALSRSIDGSLMEDKHSWYSGAELEIQKSLPGVKETWTIVNVHSGAAIETKLSLRSVWQWTKERIEKNEFYIVDNFECPEIDWHRTNEMTAESFAYYFIMISVDGLICRNRGHAI